jgi:uncharacterized protein (DUF2141 family)
MVRSRRAAGAFTLVLLVAWSTGPAFAADVLVRVSGIIDNRGRVGCSLFAGANGFPMDNTVARAMWQPADPAGVVCRFSGVPQGTYAVAVGHDLNGNQKVDTNFLGIPTEAWGVSNNVRPAMRAPRFSEAAFNVAADSTEILIDIGVRK